MCQRDPATYKSEQRLDLNDAVEGWLQETIGLSTNKRATSLGELSNGNSHTVVVVTHDWLWGGKTWKSFFKSIRSLAREAQKKDMPVWVMIGDVYDHEFVIPAALLVALCGGATILLPNTVEEGKLFGLIFPSGPHIWIMPPRILKRFEESIVWTDREKRILVAQSGESRRVDFMKVIGNQLSRNGWLVQGTEGTDSYDSYIKIMKNSQVVVTTCWVQQYYILGSKRTRARISPNTLTGRALEGFAAGATVVTNSNAVFDSLGFMPGEHFVELWDENESENRINLPTEAELEQIARAGHELLLKLIHTGNRPLTPN